MKIIKCFLEIDNKTASYTSVCNKSYKKILNKKIKHPIYKTEYQMFIIWTQVIIKD